MEPTSPSLAGRFLTPGPQGSLRHCFESICLSPLPRLFLETRHLPGNTNSAPSRGALPHGSWAHSWVNSDFRVALNSATYQRLAPNMPVFLLQLSWHLLTGCFGGWASCRPSPEPAPTEPRPGTELQESQTHRKSRGQEEVVSPVLSPLPGNTWVDPGHQKGKGSEVRISRLLFPVTHLPEDSGSPSVRR